MSGKCPFHFLSRRSFLKSAGGGGVGLLAAAGGLGSIAHAAASSGGEAAPVRGGLVPFHGEHQAGIVTPQQRHTYFAAFDLVTARRSDVIALMKAWTEASERLTAGHSVEPRRKLVADPAAPDNQKEDAYVAASSRPIPDSGEAAGLSPSRLTLTFGFGPGLFLAPGKEGGTDRYGLARLKPEALADLPKFHGDELVEAKSGGDLSVQACGDDPQVVFHAVRQLARLAQNVAQIRWAQTGFTPDGPESETGRNLMGFKDGTIQPKPTDWSKVVWVGGDGPEWLKRGTFLVTRRIRIALEHWDGTDVEFQEQVIGRKKGSGAPLGQRHEHEELNLAAVDKDGALIIPENSHVRLAAAATNDGAQILRRGYSYNDGVDFTAERWPPWRQGMEYDAGLFFVGYQTDPRSGFIKIFREMAKLDALNQFVTHVSSGVFACPPGVRRGEYIGQKLFESAPALG